MSTAMANSFDDNLNKLICNLAVECKDLCFKYAIKQVLSNTNVAIKSGQIFALLGPSGCGKTTLLRCVLGRLKPKSGSVLVFGQTPGNDNAKVPGPGVGFMPQEVGFVDQFTIEETITYFGRIFAINPDAIRSRIEFLVKMLDLPDKSTRIGSLSGGQKRRVSFAVAVVRQPPLLVLDEPTVGLDSLVRDVIWKYLKKICSTNQVTVLMTTHYIEEASSADVVAMMRSGKILVQSDPKVLLSQLSCSTLDDAFLKLCSKEEILENDIELNTSPIILFRKQLKQLSNRVKNRSNFNKPSLTRTKALINKNMIILLKNVMLLNIFLFFPVAIIASVGLSGYGGAPRNLPISIFNSEKPGKLSEKFIKTLDFDRLIVNKSSTLEEAVDSVRSGKSLAAISIEENFSEAFERRVLLPQEVTDQEIEDSNIKLYIDMSASYIGYAVRWSLTNSYQKFLADLLITEHDYSPQTVDIPIQFHSIYFANHQLQNPFHNYSATTMLAMISIVIYFFSMLMASYLVIFERQHLLIERSFVAGVRSIEIIISNLLTLLVLLFIIVALNMLTIFVIFDIYFVGSPLTAFAMLYTLGLQGVAFGLFVSAVFSDRIAIVLASCTVLFLLLTSGLIYPIEAMPSFLAQLVSFSQMTLPVQALRSIAFRNWTATHLQVMLGFGVNFVYASVLLTFTLILFQ